MKILKKGTLSPQDYGTYYPKKIYRAQCPWCGCVFEFEEKEINNDGHFYYHTIKDPKTEQDFCYLRITCPHCYYYEDISAIHEPDPYNTEDWRIVPIIQRNAGIRNFDIICINEDLSDRKIGLTKKGDM